MNRSFIFLALVLATFFVCTLQPAQPARFPLVESQIRILEKGKTMNSAKKKAYPPAQFVFLPFQNAPGPRSSSVDQGESASELNDSIIDLSPYGKPDPPPSLEHHQTGIRFDRCIDTDLCVFIITGKRNPKGRRILVGLFRTDLPHLRDSCEQEKMLAIDAMNLLKEVLSEASQIDVYDHYKVGRKHMARVAVDGQDLSELLISQGLAVPRGHGRKDWCTG